MEKFLFFILVGFCTLSMWGQEPSELVKLLIDERCNEINIKDTIDLQRQRVRLSKNKKLIFSGGFLFNGTIVGDNSTILSEEKLQLFGDDIMIEGTWGMPARPEWFGAKGDGINYFDRELRCYHDTISGVLVQKGKSLVKIEYPASHIVNHSFWDCMPYYTTDDVFFDVKRQRFLVCVDNVYFEQWANDKEWNDPNTQKPRTDVLFSNLQTRVTTIYKDGQMVDIDSTMTDDGMAISKAVQMGRGNVILRNTIYYIKGMPTDGIRNTYWRGLCNFHFEGNHATIFVRSRSKGSSVRFSQPSWAYMYQCENGIVSNLKIKALRDRDDGAPLGLHRFDSSDSRFVAFGVFNCRNLTFEDVSFKGMSHDFIIKSKSDADISHNIRINGWKSENFTQNVFAGVQGCFIDHADLTQADLIGDGMHVIYGQSRLRGLFVKNSRFRQGGPYTSVMLTHHGGSKKKETCPDSIFYDNCMIEGARMVQGAGGQHLTFRNCIFRQSYDKLLTSKGSFVDNRYIIIGSGVNLSFEDCMFELTSSGIVNTGMSTGNNPFLIFNHCVVQADKVTKPLFIHPGKVLLSNCDFRCKGPMFSKNSSPQLKLQRCRVNGKIVNKI